VEKTNTVLLKYRYNGLRFSSILNVSQFPFYTEEPLERNVLVVKEFFDMLEEIDFLI